MKRGQVWHWRSAVRFRYGDAKSGDVSYWYSEARSSDGKAERNVVMHWHSTVWSGTEKNIPGDKPRVFFFVHEMII